MFIYRSGIQELWINYWKKLLNNNNNITANNILNKQNIYTF